MKKNQSQKNNSKEWQQVKLGDIGKVSMCKRIFKNETLSSGSIPFYKISTFGKIANSFILEEIFEKYKDKYPYPKKGEILISASGTIGRTVVFDGEKSYFQDSNIVWISNLQDKVLNRFLKYVYLKTNWISTDGGIISRLYNEDLRSIQFKLPPLPEQKRIVSVLETWDETIEKLKEKIGIKKQIKKGLMQNLLSGKVRVKGFKDKWDNVQLSKLLDYEQPTDYIVKSTEYNDDYKIPVLTAGKTFVLGYTNEKSGIFEKEKLPVIIFDDFTTANKFVNFPFKVKSSAMKILKNKDESVSNIYFIFNAIQLLKFKVGEHKRNYLSEYQYLDIRLPELREQIAIAEILTTSDKEIEKLEEKLSFIKDQKKYLLNNLITGVIRTPENLKIKK